MAYLLGWKDILRPIRDGYRHLFPSPDTGPTPEERRKQRALDQLKGFTYFDTFEQLETWTDTDADPLQRANTPLMVRSVNEREGLGKTSVLLCHDYAGNYHDYEGPSGIGLEQEKYACEYLQYVDTFIYFSHKLVCVPPPTWTNALHRNGVKALGTILIESQTPDSEKLLQHGNDGLSFPLATKLAKIADHYKFDGWLVNIEKPFPTASWNAHVLEAFLRQLKSNLGVEKQLIWYDALTTTNKVSYQNALNTQNLPFAKACGSVLTNYCWKESDAADSLHEGLQTNLPSHQIHFGIDVWAQNTTKLSHPRITYPEYGGGGTNTGVAVAKLAEFGLSAGIFAPAWTFEHFPGHGRDVEQTMWDGGDLPEGTACPCGDCDKRHQPNKVTPITSFARLYNAGSETFFFTDFSRAFSTHSDKEKESLFSGFSMHAQLGSQAILPLRTESLGMLSPLRHRLEDVSGRSQLVIEACNLPLSSIKKDLAPTDHNWMIPLFKLDMPADGSLRLRVSYRDLSNIPQGVAFYMKVSGTVHGLTQYDCPRIDHLLDLEIRTSNVLSLSNPQVDYICIQPIASYPVPSQPVPYRGDSFQPISSRNFPSEASSPTSTISDIQKSSRGEGETQHLRLCWTHSSSGQPVKGMPYSSITGSFSYFVVCVDGNGFGRAYAGEHMLPASFVERLAGREVFVKIKGIGFDGHELSSASTTLQF
ncbi:glycoside hydrolase family 85 protein [Macroventuria anomochaeta]|uniref:Glycoside hydrolase family 85 protein n=1 Tax=Macroventuria anomochaeta TaxID=301207 RepID=A0ACB6SGQ1_9PLEO|nr:glycoside hydrolase family 85 protein [Macroventuria anomochaeta]KAF2633516.1 glycoside hydrolase family 85 protein [Macroventuria anomochaeta]